MFLMTLSIANFIILNILMFTVVMSTSRILKPAIIKDRGSINLGGAAI
jgi:hypothetical protein